MNRRPGTAGGTVPLTHTADRNYPKRQDAITLLSVPRTAQTSSCLITFCIRISIDRLKKSLSPWQQTSHSLYHQLSICLPAESPPPWHWQGRGRKATRRKGITFSSLCCFYHLLLIERPVFLFPSLLLLTSHSAVDLSYIFSHCISPVINPHILQPSSLSC